MASSRELASKYGKSVDEIMSIARKCGTIPFGSDWNLPPEAVKKIEDAIIHPAPLPVKPKPSPSQQTNIPQKKTESQDTAQRIRKRREEADVALLSSKLIFVTLNAMERPGMYKILEEIVRLRMEKQTESQLIAVSSAIDQLKKDADSDSSRTYLQKNYQMFSLMRERNFMTFLEGMIAEEGLIIGSYIRKNCKGSDSILILGKNMSLNTCVYLRNNGNKGNKKYVKVHERNMSFNGILHFVNKHDDAVFGPVGDEESVMVRAKEGNIRYRVEVTTTPTAENVIQLQGNIPSEGDNVYVYRNKKWVPLKLLSMFNSGGAEGAIFTLEDDEVCAKVYFQASITERKMKKLSLLCSMYTEMRGRDNSVMQRLGWPQEVVYNEAKEPVGYIMRKFKDVRSFDTIPGRKFGEFVSYSKERQTIAAVSFVELIRFLHENNVILCDINKGNLLFDNMQRAYLVDLDSAQVTEPEPYTIDKEKGIASFYCYPANVAAPQFLPPERVNATSFTFRHTKADDVWMLQYMVFLLMTMGTAYFPYPNDASNNEGLKDIKEGNYRFYADYSRDSTNIDESDPLFSMHCIISRLSWELRKAFFNAFSGKGKRFTAKDRANAYTWMIWLVKYYYELPEMTERDQEDGKFMPSSVKYLSSSRRTGRLNVEGIEDFLDRLDSWITKN